MTNLNFDIKQKVLIAIYIEYQKDNPNMKDNIKADKLGIENELFLIALSKLVNEELICGFIPINAKRKISMGWTDDIMMTPKGIEYVESKIGISNVLTGKDKVEFIIRKIPEWSLEQLKDIAAKALVDISSRL